MKAHQRIVREDRAKHDPRPVVPLEGCYVEQITRTEAEGVILIYEWLGTVPQNAKAFYGLRSPQGELLGVSVFGQPPGTASRDVCGPKYREQTIALVRGACVHYAHQHAGSFQTARAVRMAAQDFGWRIFVAYQDGRAGEYGTIYQACNWLFIGAGTGRLGNPGRTLYVDPTGITISSRRFRALKKRRQREWPYFESIGWHKTFEPNKGKYVHFEGTKAERRTLLKALRYPILPYPKRLDPEVESLLG